MGSNNRRDAVVVGAALVQHGTLLAARRSYPAAAAGRWELPGGKVADGETPQDAVIREIREELGCDVRVVGRLPGEQVLDPGMVLRVYECELVEGEPVPAEHDAIRWLGPEELTEVAWLDADLPFVTQLCERLLDGERLPGGNVGGAARIGATVRRPTGRWTPAVHALLTHLHGSGLTGVPRVLGTDERGREVLTWLPGEAMDPDDGLAPLPLLEDAMRWLRRYHTVVAGFHPDPSLPWRNADRPMGDGEIICHNDFAVYNWTAVDDRLVGVIDWDVAGPGRPMDDIAFAAWNSVPLYRDIDAGAAARRLRVMCEAYSGVDPLGVLDAVERRMGGAVERIRAGAAQGDAGMQTLLAGGVAERVAAQAAGFRSRLPAIRGAL